MFPDFYFSQLHVDVYAQHICMCIYTCRGSPLMSRIMLSYSSILFDEARLLSQTQSSLIGLVLLASLLQGSHFWLLRLELKVDCDDFWALEWTLGVQNPVYTLVPRHFNHWPTSPVPKMSMFYKDPLTCACRYVQHGYSSLILAVVFYIYFLRLAYKVVGSITTPSQTQRLRK